MTEPATEKPAPYYEPVGHMVPAWLLIAIFLALISLTWLTVKSSTVDLGAMNIWIVIAIAGTKAILVALFFMHLWWDKPFNSVVFITALVFLVLFISLVLVDTTQYQHTIFERPPPLLQH